MKLYIRFGAQDLDGNCCHLLTYSYDLNGMDTPITTRLTLWGGGTCLVKIQVSVTAKHRCLKKIYT